MANDYISEKAKEFAIKNGFVVEAAPAVEQAVAPTQDISVKLDKETAKALIEFARNGIDKDASNDSAKELLEKIGAGIKDSNGNIVYELDSETLEKFSQEGKFRRSGAAVQDAYVVTTALYDAEKSGRKDLTVSDALEILKETRAEFVETDSNKPFSSGEYTRLRAQAVKELDYFKSSFGLN
jgi:hypothetical protein